MVDLLFEGRYDLFIWNKYNGGEEIDPQDEVEIDRLANIGKMKKGACATNGRPTAKSIK